MFTGALQCTLDGGLYYGDKCYTVPYLSPSRNMNHTEAVTECAKTGALMAEILDLTHQDALCDFVSSAFSAEQYYAMLWVGMEYMASVSPLPLSGIRFVGYMTLTGSKL